jgi:uncharacterized membrane protein YfcA
VDYRISFAGLIVGLLVGLTGMGGGSLLAPILILLFGVPPVWAVSADIAYSTVTKALGSIVHIREKHVDFRAVGWLACGSIPATLLSVLLVRYIHKHYGSLVNNFLVHAIGAVLILVAVLMFLRPYILRLMERRKQEKLKREALAEKPERKRQWVRPLVTVLVGAVFGFLVGLTSVGSGTLIIVSLAFLYPRLTPKELVGTDVFQAFLLLLAGSIGYFSTGGINWTIVGLLLIGSLPGVVIGSILTKYVPNRYLNPVLAVVLGVSGLKLI